VTWLKRQLWEAQDTIVQLHEAQWLSEERNARHSRECEAVEEIARAALASEQKNKISRVLSCIRKQKENLDNFEGNITQDIFPF
jgi:phage shock protein A